MLFISARAKRGILTSNVSCFLVGVRVWLVRGVATSFVDCLTGGLNAGLLERAPTLDPGSS